MLTPDQLYDKAIDTRDSGDKPGAIEFVKQALELDPNLAIGHGLIAKLYADLGEVEKAIELHKKLTLEPGVSEQQKDKASYELGIDYMRAGLFDRAESIFVTLSGTKSHGKVASQHLLQIYQQQNW